MTKAAPATAMRDRFVRHFGVRGRLYGITLTVFGLAWVNLQIGENFPFSNFPMFGNPTAGIVDYYFLTDAYGNPLAAREVAGVTAPAIKKMIARGVERERERGEPARVATMRGDDVDHAAQVVLNKLRRDALRSHSRLRPWPPGVQLHQALIETTPHGFRETFRRLASLPDSEVPPPQAVSIVDGGSDDDSSPATTWPIWFWQYYLMAFATLCGLLMSWNQLPSHVRQWLSAGIDAGTGNVGRLEAVCLRSTMAFVLWQALQGRVDFDILPHPQGLALLEWLGPVLVWLGNPENWDQLQLATVPLLIWYVCGWAQFIPLTLLALIHILQRTLIASQGATHHAHQLLSLVFCAQAIVAWAIFCGRLAGRRERWTSRANHTATWHAVIVVVAAAYVTSAGYKLIASNGRWLFNSHHLSAQIVKTYRQNYYNNLDPQYLGGVSPVPLAQADPSNDRYRYPIPVQAQWILLHPHLARGFLGLGFCVELLAFMAAFNRGFASLFGVALVTFHLLVLWLMRLEFPLNVEIVWVVLVNLPGWLIWWRTKRASCPTLDT